MSINTIRMINFIMQATYLMAVLVFGGWLLKKIQPSPICRWFMAFTVSLWLWVSGRFAESFVYLFLPGNNGAYVFAANYQFIGITTAASSYLIWNLYLAGYDRMAENRLARAVIFACPLVTNVTVFTNQYHHLFYTKLIMGEQVGHGILFAPLAVWGYLLMLIAYCICIKNILRSRTDRARRFFLFSAFPLLPSMAVLVRSLSGVDLFDYTPIVMAVSYFCLYLVAFRYDYLNIIPASLAAAVNQSPRAMGIFSPDEKCFTYFNRLARTRYSTVFEGLAGDVPVEGTFDRTVDGMNLKISVNVLSDGSRMVVVSDQTEVNERFRLLQEQTEEYEVLNKKLDEENRNIEVYFSSLHQVDDLKERKELMDEIHQQADLIFQTIRKNFVKAQTDPENLEALLNENMELCKDGIERIREVVAKLKERQPG